MKTYVKNTWIVADNDGDGRMEGIMFHQVATIYVQNGSSGSLKSQVKDIVILTKAVVI